MPLSISIYKINYYKKINFYFIFNNIYNNIVLQKIYIYKKKKFKKKEEICKRNALYLHNIISNIKNY